MRFAILICLTFFQLYSSEILWNKDYKSALESAQKENKMIFVFITSVDCDWCKKFETTTLRDEMIIKRINKEYSSVHVTKGVDYYPENLKAPVVPIYYFLDSNGKIVDYSRGYWDATDFNFTLDDVQRRLKKQRKQ